MNFSQRVNDIAENIRKMLAEEDDVELPDGTLEVNEIYPDVDVNIDEESETAVITACLENCYISGKESLRVFDKVLSSVDTLNVTANPDGTVSFSVTIE